MRFPEEYVFSIMDSLVSSNEGKAEGLDLFRNFRGFDFLSIKNFDTI